MKYQLPKPVIALTVGVLVVTALGAVFHSAIDRQMRSWKLLPEPERLTELYFTNPNHLPTTYAPGQTQSVAFTVHNLEYRTTNYHYQITEADQDGSRSQTVAVGRFTLSQDAYHKTTVNISTVDLGPRVKVKVELVNVNESIDYLAQRRGV